MLAQTFKSAEELKINERLYKALVEVYWMLVDEKIHAKLFDMNKLDGPRLKEDGHVCGTAGCLLGWARAVDPTLLDSDYIGRTRFLFYPWFVHCECVFFGSGKKLRPTREQGAKALHNFLTTGRADWRGVMKS